MEKKLGNKKIKLLLGAVVLLLAAALGFLICSLDSEKENIEGAGQTIHAEVRPKELEYSGKKARLKRMISTVLVIGTDTYENEEKDFDSFYNTDMADFLTLLVFDDNAKKCVPIQINRETMCDVPWISVNGKVGGTTFEQITFAHSYGSGGDDSYKNTCSAVSSLLFDAPVENYVAFTMNAVPKINDAVGGVKVTLEDDLTDISPEFTAGTTVELKGDYALRFVRTRDISVDDSNLARMSRQRQYLTSFTEKAKAVSEDNPDLALTTFNEVSQYMSTDFTGNGLMDMIGKLQDYEMMPIRTCSGEVKLGEKWAEFYPDEDSLWQIVRETLCE